MRLRALILSVVLFVPASGVFAEDLAFESVTIAERSLSAEPSLTVDPTDPERIYYTAPGLRNLWISEDGGDTWFTGGVAPTSGDSDVAVDADGTVYVSALFDRAGDNSVPVAFSTDHGRTFTEVGMPNLPGSFCDREWTVAWGHGNVAESARCGSVEQAWVSSDGGRTYAGPFAMAEGVNIGGPMVVTPDGTIHAIVSAGGIVHTSSGDLGRTWTRTRTGGASTQAIFPVLDADDAGNLYAAYTVQDDGLVVKFQSSSDGGATWTAPVTISDRTLGELRTVSPTAIFPWVSAGAAGKVFVSWFQARETLAGPDTDLGANLALPTTEWDLIVAHTQDGLDAQPSFTRTIAVRNFHQGSICTEGTACFGPQGVLSAPNVPGPYDRRMLDFFETDLLPDGSLQIAYAHARPADPNQLPDVVRAWTDLRILKQSSGPKAR